MGKEHDTIPDEPQEAPVHSPAPEVQQPNDPNGPAVPQEASQNEPPEVPQHPEQDDFTKTEA